MKRVVVIGAGQTGRGYVARYLFEKDYHITFIDKDADLVNTMNEDQCFAIHFYHQDRSPLWIQNYQAYSSDTDQALQAIYESDMIFCSVGEQNLKDVARQIADGIDEKSKETLIVTCENGINPAKVLRISLLEILKDVNFIVSQTAIFCSTVNLLETRLDILSQNETYFPYDIDAYPRRLDLNGAVGIHKFEKFLKRKIYTYNCLAGLISYCGYLKGYLRYDEAANDPDISELMDRLLLQLNPALASYFEIDLAIQEAFSKKALDKFKDSIILDYNIKNGRAAKRKLGPTERIIAPLNILNYYQKDSRILELNAAAALTYWYELQGKNEEPIITQSLYELIKDTTQLDDDKIVTRIIDYYQLIQQNRPTLNFVEMLFENEKTS